MTGFKFYYIYIYKHNLYVWYAMKVVKHTNNFIDYFKLEF